MKKPDIVGMGDGGAIAEKKRRDALHRAQLRLRGTKPSKHRVRHAWFRAPGGLDLVEHNLTKRAPWIVKAGRRRRSKIAKASRRRNRSRS